MDVLSALLGMVALVVGASGLAKVLAPSAAAGLLRSIGLRWGEGAVRILGVLELLLATGALLTAERVVVAALAVLYAVFAIVVVLARRSGAASCGCFGATSAPPSVVHVVVNLVSASVAAAAAVLGPDPVLAVAADQPLAGVPYLAAVVLGAWLLVLLDTAGAELFDEIAAAPTAGTDHAA